MPVERPAGSSSGKTRKSKAKPCPICGKASAEASKPFCSERCRDVDLNRWLSNSYVVPGRAQQDDDED
jgi:endogenous inhibitor of DNA gyrase (YacG/DUF329 family)